MSSKPVNLSTIKKLVVSSSCLILIIWSALYGFKLKESEYKAEIAVSVEQLKQMKVECEATLPRNVDCRAVVYYLPEAESVED